jgi:hypothetical protein
MDNRCSATVSDSQGWHRYQCNNEAKVERDGKSYCRIHDPEYIKAKREKRDLAYQAKCCPCGWGLKDYWQFCPGCGLKKVIK